MTTSRTEKTYHNHYYPKSRNKRVENVIPRPSAIDASDISSMSGKWIFAENRDYDAFGYNDQTYDPRFSGKWVVKYPRGDKALDDAWRRIENGMRKDKLFSAKVSPRKPEFDDQVICIYTPDYRNFNEIMATLNILLELGIDPHHICGYKRDIDTLENNDIYYYDICRLLPYLHEINAICNRFFSHNLTVEKRQIWNHFTEYFSRHDDNVSPKINIVLAWIDEYRKQHQDQNPFDVLRKQGRSGLSGLFNPDLPDSIKLFKKFLDTDQERETLDRLDSIVRRHCNRE